jgi:hypothetical protein
MKRQYYYTLDAAKETATDVTGIKNIVTEVGCHSGYTEDGLAAFHIWPTYDEKFKKAFYISYLAVQPDRKVTAANMVFTEGQGVTSLIF